MSKAPDSGYPINPALEAAVIADVEDDAPRLVYSDWLEEHGDAIRAEFIRVQCALWDKSPADEDYPDLIERHRELRVQMEDHCLEPQLPAGVGFHDSSLSAHDDSASAYHRGFAYFAKEPYVEGGHPGLSHAEAFRDALSRVVSETTIRGVHFYGFWQYFDTILSCPAAASLAAVSCSAIGPRDDGRTAVELIASSSAAANLGWLEVSWIDLGQDGDVLASADFRRLRRFEANLTVPHGTTGKFLDADWFGRLHHIWLGLETTDATVIPALGRLPELHTIKSHQLPGDAPRALASAGPFRALGHFSVRAVSLRGEGAELFAQARMPRLAILELPACGIHNDEVQTLAGAAFFEQLRVLALPSNAIGDRGVAMIASSPTAKNLRILRLGDNPFGKAGLNALARPGAFPKLTTLDLHSSLKRKASAVDVTRFLQSLTIPGLRHFNLNMWPVDDGGAQALAANPAFANLRWLSLGYCQIGEAGLRALANSPHLANLMYLFLTSNSCEKSAEIMLDPALLPNLVECWITGYGNPLREQLREARPNVRWL
jgi:uncharacterized protein (TIGR02996 family)